MPIEPDSFDRANPGLEWSEDDDGNEVPLFSPSKCGHVPHFERCGKSQSPPPPPQNTQYLSKIDKAYGVLGLVPGCRPEVIQAAFRALCKIHHPDLGGNGETMRQLNVAMDTLRDAKKA